MRLRLIAQLGATVLLIVIAPLVWSGDGTTPLHLAVYRDDVALTQKLIAEGADVRAKNTYGSTPMSEAAVVGNVEVIKALLDAGADVESRGADGQTALMVIARSSNVSAARMLIKHGANVNARENMARTDRADVGSGREPARNGERAHSQRGRSRCTFPHQRLVA